MQSAKLLPDLVMFNVKHEVFRVKCKHLFYALDAAYAITNRIMFCIHIQYTYTYNSGKIKNHLGLELNFACNFPENFIYIKLLLNTTVLQNERKW